MSAHQNSYQHEQANGIFAHMEFLGRRRRELKAAKRNATSKKKRREIDEELQELEAEDMGLQVEFDSLVRWCDDYGEVAF